MATLPLFSQPNIFSLPYLRKFFQLLQFKPHCKEDLIYVFPEMKLRGLVPNFHIHVTVIDSYIPMIGPAICCKICRTILGIYESLIDTVHECRNWERGPAVSFLGIFVSNFRYIVFAVRSSDNVINFER